MRVPIVSLFLIALASAFTTPASAEDESSLADALSTGKLILNLRPRYETVDQANFSLNAEALTMRTLLGVKTGSWYGLSFTGELINVSRAIDDYNDTLNGKTQYPVIADPVDTDANQLYLDYRGFENTLFRGGRQAVKLDNMRFIGNVAFRQVMQVFNGVIAENTSLPNTRLYAGYLGRVKTVTTRQFATDTILLNAHYSYAPDSLLVGYGYFQDQANAISASGFGPPLPTNTSNQIIGIRANGAHPIKDVWKLLYTAEFATQNNYADGDPRIDADYYHVGAGAAWGTYRLRVDYSQLGSNNGEYGFQTPLGTNHLFQGWADQFLTTPPQGVRDANVTGEMGFRKTTLQAAFHQFEAAEGGLDFGNELDLAVSYKFLQKLVGKIEYADYNAGDTGSGKVDVTKLWVTLIFNY